jgi:hypothetical protein
MLGNASDQRPRRAQTPPHHLPFLGPREPDLEDTSTPLPPMGDPPPRGWRDPEDSGTPPGPPPPNTDPPPRGDC